MRRLLVIAALACALAATLVGSSARTPEASAARSVTFAVSLTGTQISTWTSQSTGLKGTCASMLPPVAGSGEQRTELSTPRPVRLTLIDQSRAALPALRLRVRADAARSGSFVERWSAVNAGGACKGLPTTDLASPTTRCGPFSYTAGARLTFSAAGAAVADRGAEMRMPARWSEIPGDDCPWLRTWHTLQVGFQLAAADPLAADAVGGLLAATIVGPPRAELTRGNLPRTFEVTSHAVRTLGPGPAGGATVTLTTTVDYLLTLTPAEIAPGTNLVVPGRSIAGFALGQTFAQVRRARPDFRLTVDRVTSTRHTIWRLSYPGGTWVEFRRKGRFRSPTPPPRSPIVRIRSTDPNLRTPEGIGRGAQLAVLQRIYPTARQLRQAARSPDYRMYALLRPDTRDKRGTSWRIAGRGTVDEVYVGCVRPLPGGRNKGRPFVLWC